MAAPPLLSVVIPTRDEETNLETLLPRLRASLAGIDHEILFVDDSDDRTPRLIAVAAGQDPTIDLIHREGAERAGGLSTAVLRGLRSVRGQFVCVMDADLQHPPETIHAMLDAAVAGADVVVASRYVYGGSRAGLAGAARRAISRGAGWLARLLFAEARASTDPLSGFFLCRRQVIDGIEFRPVGFKILLELLVCVPGIRVRDVPLAFAPRTAGVSKASFRQGGLFLSHIRSLVLEVQGSARRWKFALVGLSGLAILLPLVAVLTGTAGLAPLAAFLPAYIPSLLWNSALNRVWTFADQRHGLGEGTTRYLERAALSGAAMFVTYAALLQVRAAPVVAALGGAAVAMVFNAAGNRAAVHRRPRLWSDIATSQGVVAVLTRIGAELAAGRSYVLPTSGSEAAALPHGTIARVVEQRRAAIFTESASHRAQRRSNIDVQSALVVPLIHGDSVRGVLVCERIAHHPFDAHDLDRAMVVAPLLGEMIASTAAEVTAMRPGWNSGSVEV